MGFSQDPNSNKISVSCWMQLTRYCTFLITSVLSLRKTCKKCKCSGKITFQHTGALRLVISYFYLTSTCTINGTTDCIKSEISEDVRGMIRLSGVTHIWKVIRLGLVYNSSLATHTCTRT